MLWTVMAALVALLAGLWLGRRSAASAGQRLDTASQATLEHLQATNALLRTLASSPDITQSLFDLALRIRAIVPCDRVGLALLTDDREGYSTYTARLDSRGTSPRAQTELHFTRGSTVIDEVLAAREPRIIDDVTDLAPRFLDANVVKSAGFLSFVLIPLVFEGDPIGTLNVAGRKAGAFTQEHVHMLRPIAEALSLAYGNRRVANALARHQMANELSELTFAFANDMSGAVQAIIGQCELLAHRSNDPAIKEELAGMLQQAKRLREILNNMQRMTREKVAAPRPQ
jgi:transcriptional regulator with GAF, ATPase, and Fis domain